MDPESKKMLEESLALEQDSNRMLHSMRRSMMWTRVMNIIYWLIIIGISVGAFYFLQPYFDKVMSLYNTIYGTQPKLNGSNSLQDLLKKL